MYLKIREKFEKWVSPLLSPPGHSHLRGQKKGSRRGRGGVLAANPLPLHARGMRYTLYPNGW